MKTKSKKKAKGRMEKSKDFYALILREIKKGHTVLVDVECCKQPFKMRIVTAQSCEFSYTGVGGKGTDGYLVTKSCFMLDLVDVTPEKIIQEMKTWDSICDNIVGAVVLDTGKYL